jgi:cell fate regulator YaaT (PSP1 superfamily)
MIEVIGVRFRDTGKIYFFDPLKYEVEAGDHVIVETARGMEYGKVVYGRREIDEKKMNAPIKPIIRKATEADAARNQKNKEKCKEAFDICLKKIEKHKLEMKLIEAEYTFDNNKVLFYFTADGRIDFRELVKDLASVFKTRIELRQIGVRDETKIVGGIGICGRELCCHSYLSDFAPVSIKMAKEQNLSLNPTKISGVCGRLMCCLNNEEATYEYLNDRSPNVGDYVKVPSGLKGEVSAVNVLRQTVKVIVTNDAGEKEIEEYKVDELRFKQKRHRDKNKISAEEMKELEELEKQEKKERKSKLDD